MCYEHARDVRNINTLAFKIFKLDTECIYEYYMTNKTYTNYEHNTSEMADELTY